uniref:HAD family hydrolase n=1 Tax=candidate division WOR-3 bacterium TaxID=2052148 RepID=A0A7C3J5H3_UNCW3
MIKVVSFDLWNTILSGKDSKNFKEFRFINLQKIFSKYGYDLKKDDYYSSIDKTWDIFFNGEWLEKKYTPTTSSSVRTFLSYLSFENYPENFFHELVDFMESSFTHSEVSFIESMDVLIKRLSQDYKLVLISDTGFTPGKYLREVLKKVGIFEHFSLFIFSDEMGVSKPDRRIFEFVLKYFGCEPSEVVHIGDIPATDVKGAIDVGIRSVHFNKETYLFKDIEKFKPDLVTDDPLKIENFIKSL